MQARPRGARLHDYWQQASKRGAAKEVIFPGFRPDDDGDERVRELALDAQILE